MTNISARRGKGIGAAFAERGWAPVLVPSRSKAPTTKGWPELHPTPNQVDEHLKSGGNIGVLLGPASSNLVDVDLDSPEAIGLARRFLPATVAIFGRKSKPRSHWLYRTVQNPVYTKYAAPATIVDGQRKPGPTLLEVRTSNEKAHQTVVPPSIHPEGEDITWDSFGEPAVIAAEGLMRSAAQLAAAALLVRNWAVAGHRHEAHLALHGMLLRAGWPEVETVAFSVAISDGTDDGKAAEHAANVRSTTERLRLGAATNGAPVLARLIGNEVVAKVRLWLGIHKSTSADGCTPSNTPPELIDLQLNQEQRPCEYSDDALARKLIARRGLNLRYVAPWSSWYAWSGSIWARDSTLEVFDHVRELCRVEARIAAAADTSNREKLARSIEAASTVAAVERLARSDRRIAANVDQWDADPLALATPGGVVDLTTGTLRPACREDYATKLTAVAPAPTTTCGLWLEFLDRIFAGEGTMIGFVKRLAGYALTGKTTEHVFAFLYGSGANGKSVFVTTLAGVLGEHAMVAPSETFLAPRGDRHPVEVADLRGARLVFATEVDEGQRWNEARIKSLTGGEPIRARFMRQDFFTYTPQFLLIISGNHRPRFDSIDEAIRRRLFLIPFRITIPKTERDKTLPEKLRKEWPGILRWCLEGCLEWQREGLKPPTVVVNATDDYLDEQDDIAKWIADKIHCDPNEFASVGDVFDSWKEWANARGLAVGSSLSLGDALERHGFRRQHKSKARGFKGIRVK